MALLGLVVSGSGQPAVIIVSSNATFSGNSVSVDSFSSRDPNYSTGGQYDPAKVKDNGDLICNGTTANCVSIGNANIYGHVLTGPGGTMTAGQQGGVGSHAWQASNKGIEPNGTEGQIWYDHTANLTWPDVAAPFPSGSSPGGPADIVTGTPGNYVTNHYDHVLNGGNYYYAGMLSGQTIVLGSASLYLPSGLGGTENFTIATNGTLLLYAGGTSCSLAGSVVSQGGFATNFTLACLGTVSSISFPAPNFIGTIYAPRAAVTVLGPGSMIGSMIAGSVAVSGHVQFHYDESLGRPWFNLEPQSQSVRAGQTATFTVATLGSPPMTYQWWFNRTLLAGATNATLIITNASAANAGTYQAVANNPYGGAQSQEAQLTVNYPAAISQHPVSQAAVLNSNVEFAVTATGDSSLGYQWRFNGQSISGATNSSLTIASMQSSNVGSYTVVVTNAYGSATSDVATLGLANPPDFLWARRPTNQVNDYIGSSGANHLTADGAGNVFVAGYYGSWTGIDFGGTVVTNDLLANGGARFLCKYDQWGNFGWARRITTNGFFGDAGQKVAADSSGNVYICGDFSGTATFGTNALATPPGVEQMYVAKFDGQGHALWARRIAATDPNDGAMGRGLSVDAAGNVFILASYSGTADFGTTNVAGTAAFLAKCDDAGNLIWAKGVVAGSAVCAGQSGSIYTCGLILAKYDSSANLLWSRPFPQAFTMALDSAENIYASGMGNGTYGDLTVTNVGGIPDFFLAKCDSAGELVWSRQLGSTTEQIGVAVALDSFGSVYVSAFSGSGYREPILTFGNTILTNTSTFVAKYDPAGNPLWARSLGGTNRAGAGGLAVQNPGAIFLAGTFYGSAQFGGFNLTAENVQGMYVTRLAGMEPPALPRIVTQPQGQKVRVGNTASFAVQTAASGIPLSYQWYFNRTNSVPGGNNNSLNLSDAQFAAAGDYSVTVANSYGSVTSSPAGLTVYLTEAATLNAPAFNAGSGQVQFQIDGVPGFTYVVEGSTNLFDWVSLGTNTAPALFSDPDAGSFQQRFYRVVWNP